MKLFHWDSAKALQLYSTGDVIVMAEDVEQARRVALEQARTAHLGYTDMADRILGDEDDVQEFEDKLHMLKADLRAEPRVYEIATAVFVNGGE